MIEYLRECGRLLKWVFFQPSKLHTHIRHIAPEMANKRISLVWMQEALHKQRLRRFLNQAFSVMLILPVAVIALVGLIVMSFGGHFNVYNSLIGLTAMMVFVTVVVTVTKIRIVEVIVMAGVAGGSQLGIAGGIAGGRAFAKSS